MTTLGAPANSGAARCPSDPGSTSPLSPRSHSANPGLPKGPHPAHAALAANTRSGACSTRRDTPRTLPRHTHVLSHAQLGKHQTLGPKGNLRSGHTGSGPVSEADRPLPPSAEFPPRLPRLGVLTPRVHAVQSFFPQSSQHPSIPLHTSVYTQAHWTEESAVTRG